MKLTLLRLSNFQSFGSGPTAIDLTARCFLLGPNGTGKTAVLQALARMFAGYQALLARTAYCADVRGPAEPRLRVSRPL